MGYVGWILKGLLGPLKSVASEVPDCHECAQARVAERVVGDLEGTGSVGVTHIGWVQPSFWGRDCLCALRGPVDPGPCSCRCTQGGDSRPFSRYLRNSRVTPRRLAVADMLWFVSRSTSSIRSVTTWSTEKPSSGILQAGLRQLDADSGEGSPRPSKWSKGPRLKISSRSITWAS